MKRTCLFVTIAFLAGLGIGVFARSAWTHHSVLPPIESLAVLPLGNLSGDPKQDYFAAGVTEALSTELAKISAVRVISQQSTMQYQGTRESAQQIAHELRVDAVVKGSVVRAGNQVRITVLLIHALTDQQLWANSYQGELRDILPLQREIAQAIANEIK
jgi:TolB-like protein